MGTPTTIFEARGVKRIRKGMAPQSMLTLFWAFIVACLFGVTYAYPSNIQEILEHQNGENTAQIAKILSHFSPDTDQDDSKDLEKRSKSFSAWGGKRGGQGSQFSAWGGKRGGQGSQFSAWGGKRSGQGSQFSAWGGKRSDWVDLVRHQLAEEALREMAERRPNRVVRAGRASFSAWGGRK